MLTQKEKEVFKQDSLSQKRKEAFRISKNSVKMEELASRSLDDYLKFLQSIQKVFAAQPRRRITVTRFNKL